MSTVVVTNWSFRQKMSAIALFVILAGCTVPSLQASNKKWKTYSNSRYGFEFPYPSNWNSLRPPDNMDGITFVSPRNNAVNIRGWAGNQLSELIIDANAKKSVSPNFQTAQGISGVLTVEVGQQESKMTLKLAQGQVKYYWQGKAPSQEFDHYYRLFYYIAQNYRISH